MRFQVERGLNSGDVRFCCRRSKGKEGKGRGENKKWEERSEEERGQLSSMSYDSSHFSLFLPSFSLCAFELKLKQRKSKRLMIVSMNAL